MFIYFYIYRTGVRPLHLAADTTAVSQPAAQTASLYKSGSGLDGWP